MSYVIQIILLSRHFLETWTAFHLSNHLAFSQPYLRPTRPPQMFMFHYTVSISFHYAALPTVITPLGYHKDLYIN